MDINNQQTSLFDVKNQIKPFSDFEMYIMLCQLAGRDFDIQKCMPDLMTLMTDEYTYNGEPGKDLVCVEVAGHG